VLGEVFPHRVRLNSTKPLLGHTLGASGAFEAVATVLTLREGTARLSRNLAAPVADLAFVTQARPSRPRALSRSPSPSAARTPCSPSPARLRDCRGRADDKPPAIIR
jgi:hypothetical protein